MTGRCFRGGGGICDMLMFFLKHTHVGFYGLRGLSIGVMVFILYKLYVLLPYTYPTPILALTGDGAFQLSP